MTGWDRSSLWPYALVLGLLVCGPGAVLAGPFPCDGTGVEIGGDLPAGYEPSGAVWHDRFGALFVVSDGGQVSMLDASGSNVTTWNVAGDLEAVCVADPQGDFVYLGVERPDSVIEFNHATGAVVRTFDLTPWMTGPSNSGLEALTFVPDESHPEGGLFYAGLQDDGRIYVFELPIASSGTSVDVTHVTTLTPVPGRTDLSGLDYHRDSGILYAVFDGYDALRAMEPDTTFLAEWDLPGNDQEGIAFAGCELFVAQDVGKEVWSYFFAPNIGDQDCDGQVTAVDYSVFAGCAGGPGLLPTPSPPMNADQCLCAFDSDADQDVDLFDYATFSSTFDPGG